MEHEKNADLWDNSDSFNAAEVIVKACLAFYTIPAGG